MPKNNDPMRDCRGSIWGGKISTVGHIRVSVNRLLDTGNRRPVVLTPEHARLWLGPWLTSDVEESVQNLRGKAENSLHYFRQRLIMVILQAPQ